MSALGFAFFDTPIGQCGIAWSGRGVIAVQLPEAREAATRSRLLERCPEACETPPPPEVRHAVEAITSLLRGEASDLSGIELDMEGVPPFFRRVYEASRAVGPRTTLSYGELAAKLGAPGAARAVGQAMGRNPFAIVVPCHRVLAAGGKLGGFSANGGIATKRRLLAIEGMSGDAAADLFDAAGAFRFDPAAAIAHLRAADPTLARIIDAAGPFRLRLDRATSTFATLAEAIVYQQLNGKAAATIYARLCALFPRAHSGPTAEQVLRASDAKLRSAGLSRSKLLSIRDLARRTVDGEIPTLAALHRMEDEAIIERLTTVRGVGRWTAEMLLISPLGRPDVLPVDDYGIRQGFAIAFKKRSLPTREMLAKHGERWRPYRTVASWYLWRAVELRKPT